MFGRFAAVAAATGRQILLTKFSISHSHSILTPDQPFIAQTGEPLEYGILSRWLTRPRESPTHKAGFDHGSAALDTDALPLDHPGGHQLSMVSLTVFVHKAMPQRYLFHCVQGCLLAVRVLRETTVQAAWNVTSPPTLTAAVSNPRHLPLSVCPQRSGQDCRNDVQTEGCTVTESDIFVFPKVLRLYSVNTDKYPHYLMSTLVRTHRLTCAHTHALANMHVWTHTHSHIFTNIRDRIRYRLPKS